MVKKAGTTDCGLGRGGADRGGEAGGGGPDRGDDPAVEYTSGGADAQLTKNKASKKTNILKAIFVFIKNPLTYFKSDSYDSVKG